MKKIKRIWRGGMTRPLIYMTFTRFILALFITLLADYFLSPSAGRDLKETVFLLAAVIFAVLGWIALLRLDGIRLPKFMMLRVNPRKKPSRMYGDMIDFVDENVPETFEELEDNEKDVCILGADAFCFAVFLILAAVM
ncbi:MAG: hypothetical protein Q4G19_05165 [Clostridia bacterium]|nr:hypothetical protein [Clostridia bacterium]